MQVNVIYYLTAILLGGFHALEPGHGKTVVAAYLIGSKGKKLDAVLLGMVVTLTHTFSVILLALAAKLASTRITFTDESLHGYLGTVAGLMILAVGIWMLVQRIQGKEPFHSHSHGGHGHSHGHSHTHDHDPFHDHSHAEDHDHSEVPNIETHGGLHTDSHEHGHDSAHNHSHGHSHDESHAHSHDPHRGHSHDLGLRRDSDSEHSHAHNPGNNPGHNPGNNPGPGHDLQDVDAREGKRLGYWQLFLLGVSGGLVPCPAAIAILLAAVAAGRLGEGLTYVLLFSLGLAAVLIAIGIVVVSASKLASRFLDAKRFARKISIASAGLITLIGVVTLITSVRHLV